MRGKKTRKKRKRKKSKSLEKGTYTSTIGGDFFWEGAKMTPKLGTHDGFCPSKEGPTSLPLCIIVQNGVNIVFKWGPKRDFQNLYS
jgi:hypothetical protein